MIKIINGDKEPISLIGRVAGVCYNSKDEEEANNARCLDCISSGHDRVLEYTDLTFVIDGYSAKVIRELYTHHIGVSRLQSSTRYINYDNFDVVTPKTLKGEQLEVFKKCIDNIRESYSELMSLGVKKEDASQILPLAMSTRVVLKINLRALIHLFELRTCTRAYHEFRDLMRDMRKAIEDYSPQWAMLSKLTLKRKCERLGRCPEKDCCGYFSNK